MNSIGVMIRKINKNEKGIITNPTKKELHKQILTLHKKLQKSDKSLITTYVIEKDNHKRHYHTHLLINYTDSENLNKTLLKFIGGNIWTEKEDPLNPIRICKGQYGEIDTHYIYDETTFINYMNKHDQTLTLI